MDLVDGRYLRPQVADPTSTSPGEAVPASEESRVATFSAVCPGTGLTARTGSKHHAVIGRWEAAYSARATDPEVRRASSSAGVLTALQEYLLLTGAERALAVGQDQHDPTRSAPAVITTATDLKKTAGSRYAPVASLDNPEVLSEGSVFVGKPCEASALAKICDLKGLKAPVTLSFFCAGTPSHEATLQVLKELDCDPEAVSSVRYRGDGWPGEFRAVSETGTATMSYTRSWGQYLGRDVQWRCKLCVDGTGADADISVGDLWDVDAKGYPIFDEAEGNSVVIARTPRGVQIVHDAANAGFISIKAVDPDEAIKVQPLQADRRMTLAARLLGRRLAGYKVPKYVNYGIWGNQVRAFRRAPRALGRTLVRSRQTGADGGELSELGTRDRQNSSVSSNMRLS
ncbi:Coenzyme F420 hydrogenase/dehydrogenase, beta subunit C-terminal domain [Gordonia amicalis]|uniref:Coenzyme F420 hydrogenase/dehydrogenase, beta subunit C-terminal domain n=1 Tax=Gordonia amicalis TaxID=89053 RepID=UPI0037BFF201